LKNYGFVDIAPKGFSTMSFKVSSAGDDDVAPLNCDEDLEFRARL